jgi:hypothetical protein
MKILSIVLLAILLTLGAIAFAQDTKPEPPKTDKPVVSEVQRGPRNPQMEKVRKEMQECAECQAYRKHMKEKHPDFVGGPRGRGPQSEKRMLPRP